LSGRTIPGLRWYIAILLCLSSELNYLDRQTLSVLAVTIQKDLHLSDTDYSFITAAFLTSYTIMYAVSGRLVDLLGTRRSFLIGVSSWSLVNMLHTFARTAMQFSFFRFLLGAAEPANFPAGVKAVSEWFPMKERALAVGIFNAGTALGAAVAPPLVSFLALSWGWRSAFVFTGALGFVWVAVWSLVYRLPQFHPWLGASEKSLIMSDATGKAPPTTSVLRLLRMRETWGCLLARVLTDPISYFLIFWIPKYLQTERGFSLLDLGIFGSIPYVGLTLGNVFSGAMPRLLVSRGLGISQARKATMLGASCLMPLLCLGVTHATRPAWGIAFISGLTFCHSAWGNITLPAEVFPQEVVGTVTGFGGALGALTGAITQLVIGKVVQDFSYVPIFGVISVSYVVAFALVHALIGELGRVRELA